MQQLIVINFFIMKGFFFLFLLISNFSYGQDYVQKIKNFQSKILFSENFTLPDYQSEILHTNLRTIDDPQFQRVYLYIQHFLSILRSSILNKENLQLVTYENLPESIKTAIKWKIPENYNMLFLVEKVGGELKYRTQYVFNEKDEIVSFIYSPVKNVEDIYTPFYLNTKTAEIK